MEQNDNKKTIKTAFINTLANIISIMVGVITVPIIARILSTSDVGIVTTFTTTRNIAVMFFTGGIYFFINKALLKYNKDIKDYLFSTTIFIALAVIISFIVCLPFKGFLMSMFSLDNFLYYWLFLSMLIVAIYTTVNSYCLFHNYSKLVATLVLMVGPGNQIISILLSLLFPYKKYIGRAIGLDFTYILVTILFLFILLKNKQLNFKPKYIKESLKFTLPLIPHHVAQLALTQSDLLMISYFVGASKAGIYSMSYTIGNLAFTMLNQIMATWSPWSYRRMSNKEYGQVKINSKYMFLIAAYISLGLIIISPEVVKILLTSSYKDSVYIIPVLVVAMYVQFLYLFMYDINYFKGNTKTVAISSICAALINVILNLLLIPLVGYIAAGYTTLIGYLFLFLFNYVNVKKYNVEEIYDFKYLIICTFALFLVASVSLVAVNQVILRYILLFLITIILFKVEFKNILNVVKVLRNS